MKNFFYLIVSIFLLSFVSASCSSNQIDINKASTSDLDKLSGIGLAKAQAIVEERPFSSVDDLVNVKGIGNVTLDKIKQQGLACVADEQTNSQEQQTTDNSEEDQISLSSIKVEPIKETPKQITQSKETSQKIELEKPSESIINLNNAQQEETIVYESKGEKVNKYLLTGFCVFLIGIIFLLIRK